MTSEAQPAPFTRARLRALSEWDRTLSAGLSIRTRIILVLALITLSGSASLAWPETFPRVTIVPGMLLAGLFLPPGPLVISFGYLLAWMTVQLFIYPGTRTSAFVGFGSVLAGMVVMYVLSASRASRGLVGFAGDRMLFELTHRQRLLAQLPPLPAGWRAECVVAGADGEEFSGDFLLCTQSGRDHLEIVLVDVSGKGLRAGTRSLMLSSAFSGLENSSTITRPPGPVTRAMERSAHRDRAGIGVVVGGRDHECVDAFDVDRFLPAANSYLVRQDWREGFATAVHLDLDLTTGSFELGVAGHPPAIHFDSARGRWESVLSRSGPVLGAMDGMSFPQTSGRLNPGDALLLYTDGVIESRTNQLADGIDWMLGAIETYGVSFPGAAQRLVRGAQGGSGDDRGVVLIWRE